MFSDCFDLFQASASARELLPGAVDKQSDILVRGSAPQQDQLRRRRFRQRINAVKPLEVRTRRRRRQHPDGESGAVAAGFVVDGLVEPSP